MNRILTALGTIAVVLALTTSSAAAGPIERQTRRDAGIPRSAPYVKGSGYFIPGTPLRPEGTRCFVARTTRPTRIQGQRVEPNRLIRYCTDQYIDERQAGLTFVRYLRKATLNPAEAADRERQRLECIANGGIFGYDLRYLCTLPNGANGLPNG